MLPKITGVWKCSNTKNCVFEASGREDDPGTHLCPICRNLLIFEPQIHAGPGHATEEAMKKY